MSDIVTDPKMISAPQELGRGLKVQADVAKLSRELLKMIVEASLNAEMEAHLGYSKHSSENYNTGNSRNGYNRKTLKGDHSEIEISTPATSYRFYYRKNNRMAISTARRRVSDFVFRLRRR